MSDRGPAIAWHPDVAITSLRLELHASPNGHEGDHGYVLIRDLTMFVDDNAIVSTIPSP